MKWFMAFVVAASTGSAHSQPQSSKAARSQTTAMSDDPVIGVTAGDAAMATAIRSARTSLPYFLALADRPAPDQTDFMLKIGLPYADGVEYIWMKPFRRKGVEFVGEVSNTPQYFPNLKRGQSAVFAEDNIVDWAYRKKGCRRVIIRPAC